MIIRGFDASIGYPSHDRFMTGQFSLIIIVKIKERHEFVIYPGYCDYTWLR
jgi:hypothetical protein